MDSDEENNAQLALPSPHAAHAATETSSGSLRMTPKIPPTFDGTTSWFEFEDLIEDWLGITTLTNEKIGPSLKNALVGPAVFYKNLFDNTLLRNPDRGLAHFKEVLRPYFVKGSNHVFLYRFIQLFRTYRGSAEFVHWIGRYEIALKRLRIAWSDLFDPTIFPSVEDAAFAEMITPAQQEALAAEMDRDERIRQANLLRDQIIIGLRAQHEGQYPLSDNLVALIFLAQSDLSEAQRERFITSMSLRQTSMNHYTYLLVKQLFLELFCATRTGIADPVIQHRKRTTFLVIEEGDYEDETGYWVCRRGNPRRGLRFSLL